MQPRMTKRDEAELNKLLAGYFKNKRGMFPKGHRPVMWLSCEPVEPLPTVAIRLVDSAAGKTLVVKTTAKRRTKKLRGDLNTIAAMPLMKLGLSSRIYNKLRSSEKLKIKTIGELHGVIDDVYQIPNFGSRSIKECRDKLAAVGLVD